MSEKQTVKAYYQKRVDNYAQVCAFLNGYQKANVITVIDDLRGNVTILYFVVEELT